MRQIDYVSTTALTPINPYTQHGGGGFKKLVSVAAVIAIPIAAPIVASAVAGSLGLGALAGGGLIAGSALAGGLMGAAVGSYTGQGMKQGALMGALSGGLSGYMAGRPPAGGAVDATTGTVADAGTTSGAVYDGSTGEMIVDGMGNTVGTASTGTTSTGVDSFVANTRPDGMGADIGSRLSGSGTTNLPANQGGIIKASYPGGSMASGGANTFTPAGEASINQTLNAASGSSATTGLSPTYGMDRVPNFTANLPGPNAAPVVTPPKTPMFGDNLFGQTAAEIGSRFTNPNTLADVSIQAGVNLIGAELMGVGDLSDEEKENLRLQREQMEKLKERDEQAYNFAMSQAKKFLKLGEDFDPEQIARQAYGKATQRAGIAKRQALAKIDPRRAGLRAAEERRFNLGAAANTGSAYDRGMIQGLNQQAGYLQKASATFPQQGGNYSAALTGLAQTQANLQRKRSEAQKGVNQMFGAFLTKPGDGNEDYRAGLRDGYNAMFRGI